LQAKAWAINVSKILKKFYPDAIIILFGSRARGDNLIDSDYDIIVVSKLFENVMFTDRATSVLKILWRHGVREAIDVICYTPEEFEKKKKEISIVNEAIREGIIIP